LTALAVTGKEFAKWILRKKYFRTWKNGRGKQLRTTFPVAVRNRRGWLLGECGGCRKVPAAS
jgi:hypothetical protein